MLILAIDPGAERSGVVLYDTDSHALRLAEKMPNGDVRPTLARLSAARVLVAEYMQPRGMKTSQHEFDTMFELGRIIERWGRPWDKVSRLQVKMHVCGSARARDPNIRQALIDRWGGAASIAPAPKCATCKGRGSTRGVRCATCKGIGKTGTPGPLHGVTADCWSALAIAVTYADTRPQGAR